MHAKRSSSNNLHHRENADRDHQAETQKRSWQPKLTAQPLRSNCVHNLGYTDFPCRTEKLRPIMRGYFCSSGVLSDGLWLREDGVGFTGAERGAESAAMRSRRASPISANTL